jgi:hypothetical protein
MEIAALFIWPAVAFGVIGALAWSWLPRKTADDPPARHEGALREARAEYADLSERLATLEEKLAADAALRSRIRVVVRQDSPAATRRRTRTVPHGRVLTGD